MTETEAKALGQFRLQLNKAFEPFNMYGLELHIPKAQEQIIKLALQLHERLSGIDRPIVI